MESTKCENTFWVEALESKKGEYDFNGERSSVHKIAIEEVRIFFWWKAIEVKYVEQIKVLHRGKKISHANQCSLKEPYGNTKFSQAKRSHYSRCPIPSRWGGG
jgi:hypothetical protein